MTAAAINDLPDSAFAYIESGGSKDDQGKTVPRSNRHFPIHDKAHVQNALARAPQSPFGAKAMPKIVAAAKKFGIGDYGKNAEDSPMVLRGELQGVRETRNTPLAGFEIREAPDGSGASKLTFTGYASITESPYKVTDALGEYSETVARSAFDKTLMDNADVSFLVNHEGVSMARTRSGTLRLAADSRGLHVEASLNPSRPDVQIARAAIDDGDLNEMSFAFRAIKQEWDEEYTDRRLTEVSLNRGDVSIVNYGANPATAGLVDLRGAAAARAVRNLGVDRLAAAFRELRSTDALTPAAVATLNHVLILAADESPGDALAEFLEGRSEQPVSDALKAVRDLGRDPLLAAFRALRAGPIDTETAAVLTFVMSLAADDNPGDVLAEFLDGEPPGAAANVADRPGRAEHDLDLYRARAFALKLRSA
jgi:HK97 family phage prohead protease